MGPLPYSAYAHLAGAFAPGSSYLGPAVPMVNRRPPPLPAAVAPSRGTASDSDDEELADVEPAPAAGPAPGTGFRGFMRYHDPCWAWKVSLRGALCVVDVVGIACAASVLAATTKRPGVYVRAGFISDADAMPAAIAIVRLPSPFRFFPRLRLTPGLHHPLDFPAA